MINKLYKVNAKPTTKLIIITKYLFYYLIKITDIGIILGGRILLRDIDLKVFGNASFTNDLVTKYNTGGHIVFLIGGLIF